MAQSRDIMKGRHNVGGRTGSSGTIRSGGSEPASNKFTTKNKNVKSMSSPFVPNAKDTSADAQTMIKQPQAPFKNNLSAAQLPVGSSPSGAKPGFGPKGVYAGKSGSTVGAKALPQTNAVGYKGSAPTGKNDQVISGRFGKQLPRKAGVNGSGFPSKRNAAFYGA